VCVHVSIYIYIYIYMSLCVCVGELIECVHELQSLKVDETRTKEKQKSEAKHIVYRKRKALSDLFQNLELLGKPFILFTQRLHGVLWCSG